MILIPTIVSGGSGSRLWPISRTLRPKPFIRLPDGESLLQKAFLRGTALPEVKEVLTVTNRELFFQTEDDYRPVNNQKLPLRYILEPFGRNTAAACTAAALEVSAVHGTDAILLVLPADHLITNHRAFGDAVRDAIQLASAGKLVTFGIQPTGPESGFGYIEHRGNAVLRFIEKPTVEKARDYITAGNFLWNSGMFCFTAGHFLKQMETYAPDVLRATQRCLAEAGRNEGTSSQITLNAESFATVPDISIDYALMERSDSVAVIPCDMGWSDIGSWNALSALSAPTDDHGNRVEGDAVLHGTSNCYIQSADRIVGTAGVDNLLIIDTPDALLVANRDKAQDVKHIFAELQQRAHDAHKLHRTAYRPWGTYTVLEEGVGFKIKRIEINPGSSLSLQMHKQRSEHWVVVSGRAQVVNGDKQFFVHANESTYIPAGHQHRLANPDSEPLVIIEIQTGLYLGEDDIVRFEDVYGRV